MYSQLLKINNIEHILLFYYVIYPLIKMVVQIFIIQIIMSDDK